MYLPPITTLTGRIMKKKRAYQCRPKCTMRIVVVVVVFCCCFFFFLFFFSYLCAYFANKDNLCKYMLTYYLFSSDNSNDTF